MADPYHKHPVREVGQHMLDGVIDVADGRSPEEQHGCRAVQCGVILIEQRRTRIGDMPGQRDATALKLRGEEASFASLVLVRAGQVYIGRVGWRGGGSPLSCCPARPLTCFPEGRSSAILPSTV